MLTNSHKTMGKEARIGTFEELMADSSSDIKQIADNLKDLIQDVHPDAVEVVRLGDRAACYGVGPKKMSEAHTYIMPHKQHVNLGFFYGASLDDPSGLLEGSGKKMRHIKVRSIEEVSIAGIKALIEAALIERRSTLGVGE